MAEADTRTRYGLIDQQRAEVLGREKPPKGVFVRLFEEHEDVQWCMGIVTHRYKGSALPFRIARYEKTVRELGEKASKARDENQVPFRAVGPDEKLSKFLQTTGITDIEFVY